MAVVKWPFEFCICPPPHSCTSLLDTLFSVICNCFNKYNISDFILLGDLTSIFLSSYSAQFCYFSAIMSSLFLSQVVNEPSRPSINGSPGSFVFVSNLLSLISCQTIPALSNSDHLGLSIAVSVGGFTRRHKSKHRIV